MLRSSKDFKTDLLRLRSHSLTTFKAGQQTPTLYRQLITSCAETHMLQRRSAIGHRGIQHLTPVRFLQRPKFRVAQSLTSYHTNAIPSCGSLRVWCQHTCRFLLPHVTAMEILP